MMSVLPLQSEPVIQPRHWLQGIFADLPTPLLGGGELDLPTFIRLCERQVCAGATALVVAETVGEADTLTQVERITLVKTAVDTARGRLKVIAGGGSNCTSRAVEWAQLSQDAGADAVMSVVPYYNKPTAAGVVAHFQAVLEKSKLPVILHDAPLRCVRALTDQSILELAASPNLMGIRDDSGDMMRLARLRPMLRPDFSLLTGVDATALLYLVAGGDGVVSCVANIAPQLCRGMYYAVKKGCTRYATTISNMLAPLINALPEDQAASSVKYALSLRALGSEAVRLPRVPLTESEQQMVQIAMQAVWASPDDLILSVRK